MKLLIFNALFHKWQSMADGGWSMNIHTNELPPEDISALTSCMHKQVKVMMQQGEIGIDELGFTEDDMEKFENTQFDEFDKRQDKTPSQRLRNVMYVLYKQDPGDHADFKAYYEFRMEKLITLLKSKIEDE